MKVTAKLGRPLPHRISMLKNMTTSLLRHERIETTLARAKALKRCADRVITLSKTGTHNAKVKCTAWVRDAEVRKKLYTTLTERYQDRDGGYTRVLRTRRRRGDNAQLAYIELVDRPGELRPAKLPYKRVVLQSSSAAAAPAEDSSSSGGAADAKVST